MVMSRIMYTCNVNLRRIINYYIAKNILIFQYTVRYRKISVLMNLLYADSHLCQVTISS